MPPDPVIDGLIDWKGDATGADTNTPQGASSLAPGGPTELAGELRKIKSEVRLQFQNTQWQRPRGLYGTLTFISATQFRLSGAGDQTGEFIVGRRVKVLGSTGAYPLTGTITVSTYGAPNTDVTVVLDSGALDANMTEVETGIFTPSASAFPPAVLPSTNPFVATAIALGTTPATAGHVRIPSAGTIQARNNANSANIVLLTTDATDSIIIGASASVLKLLGSRVTFAGLTSAFPALKRSLATLQVRLADDSAFTTIAALSFSSPAADAASGGVVRLGNGEFINWRNVANTNDILALTLDSTDHLVLANWLLLTSTGNRMLFGGTSSSFPALKQSGAVLQVRLADDSAFAVISAIAFQSPSANPASAGVVRLGNTEGINWRNAANSNDILALAVSSADSLALANWLLLTSTGNRMQFGGTSSAFPSLKQSGATIQVRLADDSADADLKARRYTAGGTATVNGDYALSAQWGSTATVARTAGSNDSRGEFTVLCQGASIGANPTVTFTFKDGAWAAAPFVQVCPSSNPAASVVDATGGQWEVASVTTTQVVFRWFGTPTTALSYGAQYMVMG